MIDLQGFSSLLKDINEERNCYIADALDKGDSSYSSSAFSSFIRTVNQVVIIARMMMVIAEKMVRILF